MKDMLQHFLERFVVSGSLEVQSAAGETYRIGTPSDQAPAIRFTDLAAELRLLADPALALGELFMDGRIVVTRGTIYDVVELAMRNLQLQPATRLLRLRQSIRTSLRRLHQRNGEKRAKRNVAHHYDLDGRLYQLFLDVDQQYSCAYFEHPDQGLDNAQLAKKRHIAAKLLVERGQKVLDIGSGWGGLALYLAQHCGASVTGITLSEEQLRRSRARARGIGLNAAVDFRIQDYRSISERYDRIVSVGMFEHVGVGYYDTFFSKIADLLASDGVMVLHSIGSIEGPGANNPWMTKYIFPGGYTPALSEVLPAIERAGLIVTDIEILRLHYAQTLRNWRERFMAQRDKARALYDERFCRMWEFYLAGCEAGFRYGGLMVFQIQLTKRIDAVPLTRDYIAHREALLRTRETEVPAVLVAAE